MNCFYTDGSTSTNYKYYLSHLFTLHLDFRKYFVVSYIAISNVNSTIIIIMYIIKIATPIMTGKIMSSPQTQGKVISGEVTKSIN